MEDASGHAKCVWSVAMGVNGYVILMTPTIWSIVVESHALRKSRDVTMTVLSFVIKSVKHTVLSLWKKHCRSVDTRKQYAVARTRAECGAWNGAIKFYPPALIAVRVVAVNHVPNNAKSSKREQIGHVGMKSPLLARPLKQIAQSPVGRLWNVVISAPESVASVEWVGCTNGADRSVSVCWYVLIFAKCHVQCPVRHVPRRARTVVSTPSASTNVERSACRAVTNVSGSVPITSATNSVVSCAIVQDVTNLAARFSGVVVGVIPTLVVVCVERTVFVPSARKTVKMQSPKYF